MTKLGAIVTTPNQSPLAVITVTYSPGEYLGFGLLPGACARGTKVVLADNGSIDGVPEAAARERAGVDFLDTGGNIGYGAGMNAGARFARERGGVDEEFFLISNPDVTFTPGSIDQLIECARQWPDAAAVGPRIVEPDGSNYPSARAVPTVATGIGHALFSSIWPSNPWSRAYRDEADMTAQRPAGWLSGSCLLVRWEAFETIGGFDERYFMYLEDVDQEIASRAPATRTSSARRPSSATLRGIPPKRTPARCCAPTTTPPIAFRPTATPHGGRPHCALWLGLRVRGLIASASARS